MTRRNFTRDVRQLLCWAGAATASPIGDPWMTRQDARLMRWELVHAAGCTEPFCATKFWMHGETVDGYLANYQGSPVSVPRSLRSMFGTSRIVAASPVKP